MGLCLYINAIPWILMQSDRFRNDSQSLKKYSGDLNTELVRYSNGRKEVVYQMIFLSELLLIKVKRWIWILGVVLFPRLQMLSLSNYLWADVGDVFGHALFFSRSTKEKFVLLLLVTYNNLSHSAWLFLRSSKAYTSNFYIVSLLVKIIYIPLVKIKT